MELTFNNNRAQDAFRAFSAGERREYIIDSRIVHESDDLYITLEVLTLKIWAFDTSVMSFCTLVSSQELGMYATIADAKKAAQFIENVFSGK